MFTSTIVLLKALFVNFVAFVLLWLNARIDRDHEVLKVFIEKLKARQQDNGIWNLIYPGGEVSFTIAALWMINKLNV
jgi:hypothetical protein